MSLPDHLTIRWAKFDDLSPQEVHDFLKLRQDIFVLEQTSLYADIDGKDPEALHCFIKDKASGALIGAIRAFTGLENGDARIGRVVIAEDGRGKGLGRALMLEGIARVEKLAPSAKIHITAQSHLEAFYNSLGFDKATAPYDQDGIPHIDMIRLP
ncbi:MAG: GNAT family N-acetyltransferase [Roseibium sp.]